MTGLETERNSDSYTCKQLTFISIIQTSSINYTQLDSVAALSYHKRARPNTNAAPGYTRIDIYTRGMGINTRIAGHYCPIKSFTII